MAKILVPIDDRREVEVQKFVEQGELEGCEHLLCIEGRYYKIFPSPDKTFYSMTKIGGHMHSVKGRYDDLVVKLAKIHMAWRDYERKIQQGKGGLVSDRDQEIHKIVSG